jgi:glycosyltransferase involved in cell wall biosynthesis
VSTSVVICCHNSETRIAATLQALSKCETRSPVEVILVDNGSTDNTASTATNAWEKAGKPFTLQVVREPKLGQAYARRTGVFNAKHDIIVFCDDDNWLAPDYLMIVADALSDPKVGAVSGQADPIFEGPVPSFVYSHGYWLAIGIQALSTQDVTESRKFLWGAGLAVRRNDLCTIYQCTSFPILTGRSGTLSAASGDDNELCWAITLLGRRLVYDERLYLRHFMPKERLQIGYLRSRAADAGKTVAWDEKIQRFTAGLNSISQRGRSKSALSSAIRWLRHLNWPNERNFHASMFLAACDWKGPMSDVERRLYIAFQWFQSSAATHSAPKA